MIHMFRAAGQTFELKKKGTTCWSKLTLWPTHQKVIMRASPSSSKSQRITAPSWCKYTVLNPQKEKTVHGTNNKHQGRGTLSNNEIIETR